MVTSRQTETLHYSICWGLTKTSLLSHPMLWSSLAEVLMGYLSTFSGNFDNIFWHGLPEKLCLRKTFRTEENTTETCNSTKQLECQECLSFHNVQHLPTYFCINPGRQGQYFQHLCPTTTRFPAVQKYSSLLNRVSNVGFQMHLSVPTHDTTPYFTVVFANNNHGSWIEIVAEVISEGTDELHKTMFQRKYHSENLNVNNNSKLTEIYQHVAYFLWMDFHLRYSETEEVFNIKMESEFPDSIMQDISAMEWESQVFPSKEKHVFCVSIPGVLSTASITRKGNAF